MTDIKPGRDYIVYVNDDLECVEKGEIVRCKDCEQCIEVTGWHYPICKEHTKNVRANYYCSWGVRRDR